MAKIVVSLDGAVLQEMTLSKERTSIGRRSHNDVVIDNRAISGDHAVIVTILHDAFLEDLNSTNGTLVNGQPITKHFLQNNDVIELAKYKIRFLVESSGTAVGDAGQSTQQNKESGALSVNATSMTTARKAAIKVISGANAGKEMILTKALTTIGRPGVQVAVISRRPQGYYLTHVEGAAYPLLNGEAIDQQAHSIKHGDVIELSGTQMAFSLE
jgi:pSer/pThr/pTyr-binding forkhead associated (FHA) protein